MKKLQLPKLNYGPFAAKIIHDFMEYHNIPKTLEKPENGLLFHIAFSRLLDLMAYSMGEEKREAILKDLEEYRREIPAQFKY